MRHREPLDMYDRKPEGMENYLRYNQYHFNKKMCEFAVSMMKKKSPATGKEEKIEPWSKEQVEELLKKQGVILENNVDYDFVYVANMCKADFYKSSIADEAHVALYIKDVVDDVDQQDGFIFNRFYADCTRNGIAIPWDEMI